MKHPEYCFKHTSDMFANAHALEKDCIKCRLDVLEEREREIEEYNRGVVEWNEREELKNMGKGGRVPDVYRENRELKEELVRVKAETGALMAENRDLKRTMILRSCCWVGEEVDCHIHGKIDT